MNNHYKKYLYKKYSINTMPKNNLRYTKYN